MTWTTASGLREQVRRWWDRGALLRCLLDEAPAFPRRLTLRTPGSRELTERFEEVRAWLADLASAPEIRFEWRQARHPILGTQRLPESAWIDDLDRAFALIEKRRGASRFQELAALTRQRQPELLAWLGRRPLQALELYPAWERLLAVVAWLRDHPRPRIYLRQVDLPGIDSKLIEMHRGTLAEWLDLVLPPEAIDSRFSGTGRFAARYGFLEKPVRVRFRILDERLALIPWSSRPDVTLDAETFSNLATAARRVFITENETNFLAFPAAPDSLVLFGAGYGWSALSRARWLERCQVHYWGDIDTHGFAILDQLRGHFGGAESFLMDRKTLMAHETAWGTEESPVLHDLSRLTPEEEALFDDLRDHRIRWGLRLEQERVTFGWLERALGEVLQRSV